MQGRAVSVNSSLALVEKEVDDEDVIQLQFKVILVGDGAVGKTSLATRFTEDNFNKKYKQTIGVDFFVKRIQIAGKYHITLQIWDIGGQSIGSRMISNYVSGAHAVMMCYDITNYDSFVNLEDWYRLVLKCFPRDKLPITALVANKSDLRHLRVVRPEHHDQFAKENLMHSFLLSAKSGDHVNQAFLKLSAILAGIDADVETLAPSTVIPAMIIDHPRHDKRVNGGKVPEYTETKPPSSNMKCVIS